MQPVETPHDREIDVRHVVYRLAAQTPAASAQTMLRTALNCVVLLAFIVLL
ncbi:hypothetical protein [Bradyrhizobium algeriense]|uniref:hypothetical protein n=1 Tax=Bradyrhizobium algeriense TaxID=634784 RepID=UPI00167DBF99|nr:hypothetical protein [Bradyrhizobium algeriense]